jgi:Na+/melibiose symporter-like transporter
MYLLIFYTNVFGLPAATAAVMFLIVRLIDVIWDPIVGAFVDKRNPRMGKYRSYLILGGIPLTGFAILCFWNGSPVRCCMPISPISVCRCAIPWSMFPMGAECITYP